ncbi:MAG: hypothetical protein IT463_13560 [Planctomycetes bacterium]|nr:hypothetical protein [Planctomycetota bacterium]
MPGPKVGPTTPEVDPLKSNWPKFERKAPKAAVPGKATDYFDEDFDGPRYDWKWLPGGTRVAAGKPGVSGALEVDANKGFHMDGSVGDGEVSLTLWRDMDEAERRKVGADSKAYEIQFRYSGPNDYHALQVRGDGYYRVVRVSGGKTTTLVGDNKGDYLPVPGWDRDAEYDRVVLTFRGKSVAGTFNGRRLATTEAAGEGAGKVGLRTMNGLAVAIEKLSVDE